MRYLLRTLKKGSISFYQNNGFITSKALAFQTLFCFLPTFLLLLFLSSFSGVFEPLINIQQILSNNFIPKPMKEQILEHINTAFNHSQSVFTVVLIIFIISSFSMITDIHDSLYQLSVKTKRVKQTLLNQILIYIFLIFFGLILFISNFLIGSIIFKSSSFVLHPLIVKGISLMLTTFIIFFIFRIFSPFQTSSKISLLISLIISFFLILGQKLFLLYLAWFPGYMLVYGVIAILPIFFFWVYLHWIIILFGYSCLVEAHTNIALKKKVEDKSKIEVTQK